MVCQTVLFLLPTIRLLVNCHQAIKQNLRSRRSWWNTPLFGFLAYFFINGLRQAHLYMESFYAAGWSSSGPFNRNYFCHNPSFYLYQNPVNLAAYIVQHPKVFSKLQCTCKPNIHFIVNPSLSRFAGDILFAAGLAPQ
jgi:hypothetical protein